MPSIKVSNITSQWLVLNKLNVKIPPKSENNDLFIDEKDLDNPDIKELLAGGKISVQHPGVAAKAAKPAKGKRGRKKKEGPAASRESVERPQPKPQVGDSPATIMKDGSPTKRAFMKSSEQGPFIDKPEEDEEDKPSSFIDINRT